MTETKTTTAAEVLLETVASITGVDPSDVNLSDHLEDDLFLDLEVDVPQLISATSTKLGLEVSPDALRGLVTELSTNPTQATLARVADILTEEVEFN